MSFLSKIINKIKKAIPQKQYWGLYNLDEKISKYLDYKNGFYIEMGANDGVLQSNTLFYEKNAEWRGILIEPWFNNYLKCIKNRSRDNYVIHAACVPFGYSEPTVKLFYSGLMTICENNSGIHNAYEHAVTGSKFISPDEKVQSFEAPAATLNSLLEATNAPLLIDFFSLDVEGFEMEVLKGVDHSKYRFKYILIESRNFDEMKKYMQSIQYKFIDQFNTHDLLFANNLETST